MPRKRRFDEGFDLVEFLDEHREEDATYWRAHLSAEAASSYEHLVYRADTYDSWLWQVEQRYLMDVLARYLGDRDVRFLDLACGTGRVLAHLAPMTHRALGADVSPEMLKLAALKVSNVPLLCADVTNFPAAPSARFDLITAFRLFLNAEDPLRHATLRELRARLADGGVFVFNVHGNTTSLRFVSYLLWRYRYGQRLNQMSYRQVRRLLHEHGLEIVEFRGVGVLTRRMWKLFGVRVARWFERLATRFKLLQYLANDLIFVAIESPFTGPRLPAGGTASRPWTSVPGLSRRVDVRVAGEGRARVPLTAIYRPIRAPARIGLRIGQALVGTSIARPVDPPLDDFDALMEALRLEGESFAVMRQRARSHVVIGVANAERLVAVVKVGRADDRKLRSEAETLARLRTAHGSFSAPRLLWAGTWRDRFVVAAQGVDVVPRPPRLQPADVVGVCVAMTRVQDGAPPVTHGDFTSWNVLTTDAGLVVVDWEDARFEADPLYDLAHFVVSDGVRLRRCSPLRAVELLTGVGSPGRRYLDALDIAASCAPALVRSYLDRQGWSRFPYSRPYVQRMHQALEDMS